MSKERQLLKLMTGLELGDKRPTQLLREMRTLAGSKLTDEVLSTLWMRTMPTNVRCVLSASKNIALNDLAQIADRIIDNSNAQYYVSSFDKELAPNSNHAAPLPENLAESRIDAVEKELAHVTSTIRSLSGKLDKLLKSQGRFRSQSRCRGRESNTSTSDTCYYHQKYGSKARKCTAPCVFNGKDLQGN